MIFALTTITAFEVWDNSRVNHRFISSACFLLVFFFFGAAVSRHFFPTIYDRTKKLLSNHYIFIFGWKTIWMQLSCFSWSWPSRFPPGVEFLQIQHFFKGILFVFCVPREWILSLVYNGKEWARAPSIYCAFKYKSNVKTSYMTTT